MTTQIDDALYGPLSGSPTETDNVIVDHERPGITLTTDELMRRLRNRLRTAGHGAHTDGQLVSDYIKGQLSEAMTRPDWITKLNTADTVVGFHRHQFDCLIGDRKYA